MSIISKIYKLLTFKEVISDPIYSYNQIEAIIYKLKTYIYRETFKATYLLEKKRAISSKQVFKVKYNKNNLVVKYKTRLII